jgi:hypothetical protein
MHFRANVRFFPENAVYQAPPGFASNIVQGKSYDMSEPRVAGYFGDVMQLVLGREIEIDLSQPWHDTGPVFGDPRLAPYRLAQRAFQAVVLNTYHGHCAITGTKIRPVLQAAHIRPVTARSSSTLQACTSPEAATLAVDDLYRPAVPVTLLLPVVALSRLLPGSLGPRGKRLAGCCSGGVPCAARSSGRGP